MLNLVCNIVPKRREITGTQRRATTHLRGRTATWGWQAVLLGFQLIAILHN